MVDREDGPAEQEDASTSSGMPDLSALTGGGAGEAGGGAGTALPGIASVAGPGGMSPGGSAAGGLVQDTVQAGQAVSAGDVNAASDAVVRGAATGAGYYFGGEAGGQVGRIAANIVTSTGATKALPFVVLGIISALVLPLFAVAAPIAGFAGMLTSTTSAMAASCVSPVGGSGSTPLENPTQEEVVGAVYAQVKGYGYGDYAAAIAVVSAYFESNFTNKTIGDNWTSGAGMTGSRGIYQQFPNVAPKELAWSGKPDPGYGNDYGMYNDRNAWGPNGWARLDPRMNVPQAANLFVLGMGAGSPNSGRGYWGLDSPYMPNKEKLNTNALPSFEEAWAGTRYVQDFSDNARNRAWATQAYPIAMKWFEDVRTGKIPVPGFVAPLDWMEPRADSPQTRAIFTRTVAAGATVRATQIVDSATEEGPQATDTRKSRSARTATPTRETTPSPDVRGGDGILLLGDSVMEGLISTNNPPRNMFGGPSVKNYLTGVSLSQVLNSPGSVESSLGNRSEDMSEWRKDIQSGPSRILVQLGTNPSSANTAAGVSKFMDLAGPGRQVFWFAPHYAPAVTPMTDALTEASAKYPNLTVIPVKDLLPDGKYGQAGSNAGMHPYSAYPQMWQRAMEIIAAGDAAAATVDDPCAGRGTFLGSVPVNPGATPLPSEDQIPPAVGWTVNTPGGRNMVYYSQNDPRWGRTPGLFSGGTVGSCGCGPTSMAMVVATLGNLPNFTPVEAIALQRKLGGILPCGTVNGASVFPRMAEQFGIQGRYIGTDWNAARETLRKGGLIIASMHPGIFTSSGHLIVIRGMTADGRFLVADPNAAHHHLTLTRAFSTSEFNFNWGMAAFLPGTSMVV